MKQYILGGIGGLIVGLIVGFFATNSINRNLSAETGLTANSALNSVNTQTEQNPNAQGGMLPDIQIKLDKAKNEPENFVAQMEAGDMYAKIKNFEK